VISGANDNSIFAAVEKLVRSATTSCALPQIGSSTVRCALLPHRVQLHDLDSWRETPHPDRILRCDPPSPARGEGAPSMRRDRPKSAPTDLPAGRGRQTRVNPLARNISVLRKVESGVWFSHPASLAEGRIAIVTRREAGMRWTRMHRLTSGDLCGRRSRVVLARACRR
jgi:hypothetical protein